MATQTVHSCTGTDTHIVTQMHTQRQFFPRTGVNHASISHAVSEDPLRLYGDPLELLGVSLEDTNTTDMM